MSDIILIYQLKIFVLNGDVITMRGSSHIVTGIATAAVLADGYILLHAQPTASVANNISVIVSDFMLKTELPIFVHIPLCAILYLLGLILPDIDHPYSIIGKIFYLPVQHRTWTHCWLPLLLAGIGSIWFRPLFFLGLGMFVHMFFDSFSASGLNWFYPYKAKHVCGLYHTGQPTEYVFATIFVMIAIIGSVFTLQYVYHIFDFFLR